jgi:hypothetical protein
LPVSLEARLTAAVPEYMTSLRASKEWGWTAGDVEGRTCLMLEHLRLYLFHHRRDKDLHARAWAAVEELAAAPGTMVLDALMVGLLEGHWPKRDAALMGPRTRALWDQMRP